MSCTLCWHRQHTHLYTALAVGVCKRPDCVTHASCLKLVTGRHPSLERDAELALQHTVCRSFVFVGGLSSHFYPIASSSRSFPSSALAEASARARASIHCTCCGPRAVAATHPRLAEEHGPGAVGEDQCWREEHAVAEWLSVSFSSSWSLPLLFRVKKWPSSKHWHAVWQHLLKLLMEPGTRRL